MYVDKKGRWFIIDDLIMVGVSFTAGYLHHGISKGDWGWEAVKSGGYLAAQGWLALNTGGASAGFWGSVGWSASAIASSYLPSANMQIGNVSLSLSPSFSLNTNGISLGLNLSGEARFGNSVFGGSIGVGGGSGLITNGPYITAGVFGGYTDGNNKFLLSRTQFRGTESDFNQTVDGVQLGNNQFSLSLYNDLLNSDKGRTSTLEISAYNFKVGSEIYTNNAGSSKDDNNLEPNYEDPYWGGNEKNTYKNGKVYFSSLYCGIAGQNGSVHRFGINEPWIQGFFSKWCSQIYFWFTLF
ncbi:MAG: polymorphic toxin type 23 domain-containing protein [Chloroherpetonaceae bacterium]|nr:polymorphic toxin type 23 domain-containing protein [Chloroherpetonaceae bacterium]